MTLRSTMTDWLDWDEAAESYGRALGIFDGASQRQVNQIVLSDNPLGGGLHAGMMALVQAGVVERREEPDEQFRWIFGTISDILGDPDPMSGMMSPGLPRLPAPSPDDAGSGDGSGADEGGSGRWWRRR
jgi:hypothetical protein